MIEASGRSPLIGVIAGSCVTLAWLFGVLAEMQRHMAGSKV